MCVHIVSIFYSCCCDLQEPSWNYIFNGHWSAPAWGAGLYKCNPNTDFLSSVHSKVVKYCQSGCILLLTRKLLINSQARFLFKSSQCHLQSHQPEHHLLSKTLQELSLLFTFPLSGVMLRIMMASLFCSYPQQARTITHKWRNSRHDFKTLLGHCMTL